MPGTGSAPFPITTRKTETQEWYDQGNALLHSFWFEEAERSFRWCHKLEPNNPMVYLGLARCGLNWFTAGSPPTDSLKRYQSFLKEAVKRKDRATDRERMYIEAWEEAWFRPGVKPADAMVKKLGEIALKYPHDPEAIVLLGLFSIGNGNPLANDALIKCALATNPMHPGAHHALIHNWDGVNSQQALNSCERYGRAAPGVGHSLHMPGHIYSKVGMWHEAAIAMDRATRVELRYMNERMTLPYETWNYAHNRDYLCYIQEQLGRANDSLRGARDLIASPRPPDLLDSGMPAGFELMPLLRALVKFERWEEILGDPTIRVAPTSFAYPFVAASRTLALLGTGKTAEGKAELARMEEGITKAIQEEIAKSPDKKDEIEAQAAAYLPKIVQVARAQVKRAEGDTAGALAILRTIADGEAKERAEHKYVNDPPMEPWPVARLLGDLQLDSGDTKSAITTYEKALAQEPGDAWCLAGLAKAWVAQGDRTKAREYAGRLLSVWSGADEGLRPMREVQALKLDARPISATPRPERRYRPADLDRLGPSNWRPFSAPKLEGLDPDGKPVRLEQLRGKNVLLVFYLSDQCVHCVEQLAAINAKADAFATANTVVLAVSADPPAKNKANQLSTFKLKLVSDPGHASARRFDSYDDFESMELHSTILIDPEGKVRWKKVGGDPFMQIDFLLSEIGRWK